MTEDNRGTSTQSSWPEGFGTTADPGVDAVVSRLTELASLPTAKHAAIYDSIHDQLKLELDVEPGPGAGSDGGGSDGGAPKGGV